MSNQITFIQYLRPDGRKRPLSIEVQCATGEMADFLTDNYMARFEVEVLTTGEVAMSVERDNLGEVDVLANVIVPNGPSVPKAVEELVATAYGVMQKRSGK